MCSASPCGNDCIPLENKYKLKSSNENNCQKCEEPATVLLRKKDPLCNECFLAYCKHKFRATLGKGHVVKPGDKILLAFSGGCASTALLHMIREALSEETKRRLLIEPVLLFIYEGNILCSDAQENRDNVIESMTRCGFPSYYATLEMSYRDESDVPAVLIENRIPLPPPKQCLVATLQAVLDQIKTLTVKEEFLKKLRDKMLTDVAEFLHCDLVFVGDSASRLSVQLLSGIALGEGSQLGSKISLKDHHYKIPIARPLREFLARELALYNHIHCNRYMVWPTVSNQTNLHSSISRLTESFVTGLQNDFPATVSTIFRIGSKLQSGTVSNHADIKVQTCALCHALLSDQTSSTSAAKALAFSEEISSSNKRCTYEKDKGNLDNLCFSCQILTKDMA